MEVINAIGRRKSAVARVYVKEGNGKITINKRDLANYFTSMSYFSATSSFNRGCLTTY